MGSENRGLDSGLEQLMKLLLEFDWTGANGYLNCMVLVLVKRARTARYLANYLSNCAELCPRLHGVRTTYIAGNGGGFVAQGKAYSRVTITLQSMFCSCHVIYPNLKAAVSMNNFVLIDFTCSLRQWLGCG